MKVGLYSITYSGTWYNSPPLDVFEFMHKAKEIGYDGIEIDLKRPHGFPLDIDDRKREAIRELADELALEIAAMAANNNFASPIPENAKLS